MKKTLMAMALVLATAGAALANQCPLLIKQIEDATAGKTDDASKKAQALAKEAKALHDSGKHAESVAKADEAAAAIGLTLKKK
jgi:ATP-dependent protease ClpP protease subunit